MSGYMMKIINFIIKHFDSQVILFIEKSLRKLGEVRMADGNKIKINQENKRRSLYDLVIITVHELRV